MPKPDELRTIIERRFAGRMYRDTDHPNLFKVIEIHGSNWNNQRWYLVCQEIDNTEIKWTYSLDKLIPMDEVYRLFHKYMEDDS